MIVELHGECSRTQLDDMKHLQYHLCQNAPISSSHIDTEHSMKMKHSLHIFESPSIECSTITQPIKTSQWVQLQCRRDACIGKRVYLWILHHNYWQKLHLIWKLIIYILNPKGKLFWDRVWFGTSGILMAHWVAWQIFINVLTPKIDSN